MPKITRFIGSVVFAATLLLGVGALPAQAAGIPQVQANAIIAMLQALGIDQSIIVNVQAALGGTSTIGGQSCHLFNANLSVGMRNSDVMALQQSLLNSDFSIPAGATGYFGAQTLAAVIAFQKTNILPQTGYVGPLTRAKLNACTPSTVSSNVCKSGDLYNTVTGARCSAVCQSGDLYNTQTGARCSSSVGSRSGGGGGGGGGGTTVTSINGVCSSVHYSCASGTSVSNAEGTSSWTWGCNGSNGGTNTSSTACFETKSVSTPPASPFDYNNDGKIDNVDVTYLFKAAQLGIVCPTNKICDINNDGRVDNLDVKSLFQLSLNGNPYDYNNDGKIDNVDVTYLFKVAQLGVVCPTNKICDINVDGRVDVLDVKSLFQLSLNGNPYDYNNDGKIDNLDVTFLMKVGLGTASCPVNKVCDVNGDSKVDNTDTVALNKIVNPSTPTFSVYDYNNDGKIDNLDVTFLSAVFLGSQICPSGKVCDVNNDGRTNIADVQSLVNMINNGTVSIENNINQTASAINGLTPGTPTNQSPSFQYVWNNDLQIGSPNISDVSALQTALTLEGVYSGEITGGFYSQTYAAVQLFQQKYGIDQTGFVGPITRAKLNSLYQ